MASKMARVLGAAALLLPGTVRAEIKLDVMGQSGRFKLYEAGSDDVNSSKGITITMDALKEVDADGDQVGNTGDDKHSLNTFARTEFEVAEPVHNVSIGTATATRVNFTASVGTAGKISVETYLVTEGGEVGDGNVSWEVNEGDLKWNIVFPEWSFCNPCGTGANAWTGDFLDLTITVQGLADAKQKANSSMDVDLGGGVTLMLANDVDIDGELTQMPEGYPMTEFQGSKTMITFRFPKFNISAMYDPVIGLSDSEMGDVDDETEETTPAVDGSDDNESDDESGNTTTDDDTANTTTTSAGSMSDVAAMQSSAALWALVLPALVAFLRSA